MWILNFGFLRHYAEEAAIQHIMKTAPAKYHGFLIPTYPFGCKRIIYDPGYLQCLNQPNVELVTDAIDTITAKGIKGKSGKEYDMDVLILGTGFSLVSASFPPFLSGNLRDCLSRGTPPYRLKRPSDWRSREDTERRSLNNGQNKRVPRLT